MVLAFGLSLLRIRIVLDLRNEWSAAGKQRKRIVESAFVWFNPDVFFPFIFLDEVITADFLDHSVHPFQIHSNI